MAGHSKWAKVKTKGIKAASAAITFLPAITIPVADAAAATVQELAELLEEHDDVK